MPQLKELEPLLEEPPRIKEPVDSLLCLVVRQRSVVTTRAPVVRASLSLILVSSPASTFLEILRGIIAPERHILEVWRFEDVSGTWHQDTHR